MVMLLLFSSFEVEDFFFESTRVEVGFSIVYFGAEIFENVVRLIEVAFFITVMGFEKFAIIRLARSAKWDFQ